jgi:hypothetical protein
MANITPKVTIYLNGGTVDVSAYVTQVNTRRGRSRALAHTQAGSASLTLRNEDRRFDPEYASGTYHGGIDLGAAVKIYGTVSSTDYQIFDGYVSQWNVGYDGPNASTVQVQAIDGLPKLALISLESLTDGSGDKPPTFAQQASGARVIEILDCFDASGAGSGTKVWPAGADFRTIATGQSTLQAKETKSNVWAELQKVANSELATGMFISREGKFVFKDRHTDIAAPTDTFSDDGSDIAYVSVEMRRDMELLFNLVSLARLDAGGSLGGVPETSSNAASQEAYGIREYAQTDLLNLTNAAGTVEVQGMAEFINLMYNQPTNRFDNLRVAPNSLTAANQVKILEMEIADGINIERTPKVNGSASAQIVQSAVVDSISHRVQAGSKWETTYQLSPYAEVMGDFLIVDTGKIDSGKVGF